MNLQFLGAQGPMTTAQGKHIARLALETGKTDIFARHLAFEQAISGSLLISGNRVTLLQNGSAAYPAMLNAIRAGHSNFNLETYIFAADAVGYQFADAVLAKRRQGVQVNRRWDRRTSTGGTSRAITRSTR